MNNIDGGHSADLLSILKTKNIFDDEFDCQYFGIEEMFAETHGKFSVLSQMFARLVVNLTSSKNTLGGTKKAKLHALCCRKFGQ